MRYPITLVTAALISIGAAIGSTAAFAQTPTQDAQLAVRVKTALINDPVIGVRSIEVRVAQGVATLRGIVGSAEEAAQTIAIASGVDGVIRVDAELQTAPAAPGRAPGAQTLPADTEPAIPRRTAHDPDARRLLAVGLAGTWSSPRSDTLRSAFRLGPILRLGSGQGLGLAIGFGWFGTDLESEVSGGDKIGSVRIRPVMGGLGYSVRGRRVSSSLSLVGGVAFNGVRLDDTLSPSKSIIGIGRSVAWRPGASLWFDIDDRVALNVFTGYLITKPRATFLEDGVVTTRSLNGNAAIVKVGVAYKIF